MSRLQGDGFGLPLGVAGTPMVYAPVVTWTGNTIGTTSGVSLKSPGKLEVWVTFVETAGTTVNLVTVTIPKAVPAPNAVCTDEPAPAPGVHLLVLDDAYFGLLDHPGLDERVLG